ncbi:MAG: sulfite exporter TauE/SafE family protein [Rickettsiales bacterium]|nr:sulfite exporter TauE/SafE family protein [Rickettsiales bacterium]
MIAFVAILLMGITLGLLGAGGSVLTVPILVYLFGVSPVVATGYSLLLVGFTALFGMFLYLDKKQIDFNIAIKFSIPSMISVYLTRRFLLPSIPENIDLLFLSISKDVLILLLFSVVMLLASISMIRSQNKKIDFPLDVKPLLKNSIIILEAVIIGTITALIGAGGGFLIVPALILLNKIDVKTAIATSLFIIAAKSLLGFVGDIQGNNNINYLFALKLLLASSLGMFIGVLLAKNINPHHIKKLFGYFLMMIAILILAKEIFFFS